MSRLVPAHTLSAGIFAFFTHVPTAYAKKSLPGWTDLSMSAISTPQVPNFGFGGRSAGRPHPTSTKPIASETANVRTNTRTADLQSPGQRQLSCANWQQLGRLNH